MLTVFVFMFVYAIFVLIALTIDCWRYRHLIEKGWEKAIEGRDWELCDAYDAAASKSIAEMWKVWLILPMFSITIPPETAEATLRRIRGDK